MGTNRIKDPETKRISKIISNLRKKIKRYNKRGLNTQELTSHLLELKAQREEIKKRKSKDNPNNWEDKASFLRFKIKKNRVNRRRGKDFVDHQQLKRELRAAENRLFLNELSQENYNPRDELSRLIKRKSKLKSQLLQSSSKRKFRISLELMEIKIKIFKIHKRDFSSYSDYVICPICNKRLAQLTNTHLSLHGLSMSEFRRKYPNTKLFSRKSIDRIRVSLSEPDVNNSIGHRSIKGFYYSERFNTQFYYRSTYELLFIKLAELDKGIKEILYEKVVIPFNQTNIRPDFLINYATGKSKLVEIKAKWSLSLESVGLKIARMREFCLDHNLEFDLLTEENLLNYADYLNVDVFTLVSNLPKKLFRGINENQKCEKVG